MAKKNIDEKWRLFKIDDETAERIKNGNYTAVRKFYEDNEKLIRNIAVHCYWLWGVRENRNRRMFEVDDYVNTIYVDLLHYDYTDSRTLYKGMIISCRYVDCGGLAHIKGYHFMNDDLCNVSLDKAMTPDGKDFTLYKMLGSPDPFIENILNDGETIEERVKTDELIEKLAVMLYPDDNIRQENFIRRY